MSVVVQRMLSGSRSWWPSLAIVVLGLGLTGGLFLYEQASLARLNQQRQDLHARALAQALEARLERYIGMARSLSSAVQAQPGLTQAQFVQAAQTLLSRSHGAAVRSLGLTREISAQEWRHLNSPKASDLGKAPVFEVESAQGQARYFVLEHTWPEPSQATASAQALLAQPQVLESLAYSRQRSEAVLSAPLWFRQGGPSARGFVIRVPVGTASRPGMLDLVVRMPELLEDLRSQGFLQDFALSVHDIGAADLAGRMREPGPAQVLWPQTPERHSGANALAPTEVQLQVLDRLWRLRLTPLAPGLLPVQRVLPGYVLLGGLLLTLWAAWAARQRGRELASGWVPGRRAGWRDSRFQALFEQAGVGVVQVDANKGLFVHVNQRYCEISGYSVDELLHRPLLDVLHPDDMQRDQGLLEQLRSGQLRERHHEGRLRRKDGSYVWVDLNLSVLHQAHAPQFLILVQDISERKHLQQVQQDSARHLRTVLQRLPVGLVMEQADGRFAYWNDEFLRIAGNAAAPDGDASAWWQRLFPDLRERQRMHRRWEAAKARARVAMLMAAHPDAMAAASTFEPQEYTLTGSDGVRRVVAMGGLLLDGGCLVTLQDLSQRKQAEDEIRRLAFYDPLTNLPNRRLLVDRLQQALAASRRRQRYGAVLLLDVDNFKSLNESHGLERGDSLLRHIAERLQRLLGHGATISRQGGDDYVVLLEDLGGDSVQAALRLEAKGQAILAALRQPFDLHGETCHITVSIGASLFGDQEETVDDMLRRADLAMYQAKGLGRDTLQFFDPQLQATLRARTAMEQDMRSGLAQQEFELFYQPQVEDGQIVGAEGLLRWRHPRDGFVPPAVFVALAEETGLILPLGQWVLRAACRQLALWAQQPVLRELVLAVNVSPRQFHQSEFVAQVLDALAEHGADPQRLKLELTEGLLLTDVDDTVAKMTELKRHGLGFSLDDFGTGYSSLAYLKRLPLDQLKIDRSFVRDVLTDPNDAAIARTIVALAHSLGLKVIAEGVETEAQRSFLQHSNCHAWQGYLLSPPVAVMPFEALVLHHARQGTRLLAWTKAPALSPGAMHAPGAGQAGVLPPQSGPARRPAEQPGPALDC